MIDYKKLQPREVAKFIRYARLAQAGKSGALSTSEQIAGALLSGRSDLLPGGYEHPVDAIRRLGPEGLNTLLYVHERGWESDIEANVERLD